MTAATELLKDAMGRVREDVAQVLEGADADVLTYRVDPEANTIAWLIWHLTRVADDHVAEVAGTEQVWLAGGWQQRFGLPFAPAEHGYGHTAEQVGTVTADARLLGGYHDAVQDAVATYLDGLEDSELPRIVDTRWDPPVTLAVRLVSVVNDCTQHVGQAAYVRGIAERSRRKAGHGA